MKQISEMMLQLQNAQVQVLQSQHAHSNVAVPPSAASPPPRSTHYAPGMTSHALPVNVGLHSPYKRSPPSTIPSPFKRPVHMSAAQVDADLIKLQQALHTSHQQGIQQAYRTNVQDRLEFQSQSLSVPNHEAYMGRTQIINAYDQEGETQISFPSMAQLKLMGPPPHLGTTSEYEGGKHIRRVPIRNMPEENDPPQMAKIKMSNWLRKNCNFMPHQYLDLYQLALPAIENPRGPRPTRVWMVITSSMKDRDYLVDMDSVVLRDSGSIRIINDFTATEHARLKAIDPFLVGLTTKPLQ